MNRFQQSGKGLGSDIFLTLLTDNEPSANKYFKQLWTKIESFENRFSRFKQDSELTLFNQLAGQSTPISDEFQALLKTSSAYMKTTSGLFNPFILPSLQRVGYKGSWPTPDNHNTNLNYEDRTREIPSKIEINSNSATIPSGTALDFGGIGKGYLLNILADYLSFEGQSNFWLSIGGDIVCQGNDIGDRSWEIGVAEANGTKLVSSIKNLNGARLAVATSGITKRKGPGWHHIIDPRTGLSAETDILVATVATHDATEADIYAKCLVVLGSKQAEAFIKDHGVHQSVLQIWDNGIVVINEGGDLS